MNKFPTDSTANRTDSRPVNHPQTREMNENRLPCPASVAQIHALVSDKKHVAAESMCRRMLALQPNHVELLFILAELHQINGQFEKAIQTYQKILSLEPTLVEAEYNLGILFQQSGCREEAEQRYRRAIDLAPDFSGAYTNLGSLLMECGELDAAATCFAVTTRLEPENAGGYFNSGRCMFELNRYADAVACFQKAATLNPDSARAWHNLGLAHQKLGCRDQAIQSLRTAFKRSPQNADLYFDMGNLHLDRGDMRAVIGWYRRGIAQAPNDLRRLENFALLLHEQGRYEEARGCFENIIGQDPTNAQAHFNRALLLLRSGEFEQGWNEYEWRLKLKNWKKGYPWRMDKPRWRGENFKHKTLRVHCEQGFGDCLQFARYLPLVKSRGGTVVFEVPAALVPLFEQFPGADKLRTLSTTSPPDSRYDIYIPLLSLPRIFGTTPESIPCPVPYQYAAADRISDWLKNSNDGELRVGIVWAGSKVHVNDKNRSCPLSHFLALTDLPGVRIFSLQTEITAQQMRAADPAGAITHWGDRFQNFGDTAAALGALDLVITVDTAIAHLSGAMGKPTWLLLPYVPDWRWQTHRDDSPWYPSMRLFRQSAPGDWPGVFEKIMSAFENFKNKAAALNKTRGIMPDQFTVDSALSSAGSCIEKKEYQKAEKLCRAVLETHANQPQALFLLGVIYHRKIDFQTAETYYRQAVAVCPTLPEGHYNLGNIYLDQGRFKEAENSFRKALDLKPEYIEAQFNLGIALMEQKQLAQAARVFEITLVLNPKMVAAHYNLGCVYHDLNRLDEAIQSYHRALELEPAFVEACNNLGNAYLENSLLTDAEVWFRKAIAIRPEYADGHYNLGKVFQERRDFDGAMNCYRRTLDINAAYCKAWNNSAKIYQDKRNLPKAIEGYQKALDIQPDYAEARFNLATVQLLTGDFAAGWQNYEWRFRRRDWQRTYPYRFSQPRWDGSSFEGRTLYVHSEQGLGDILQFVRYLPMVKALGGRLILETPRPMVNLCRSMTAVDQVVEPNPKGRPEIDFDYYIPLLSLPEAFRTELNTIPDRVPYLSADSANIQRWRPHIKQNGLRIGLVWAGTSTDPDRACPLAWFTPLTRLDNVHFYGLQKGIAAEQIEVEGLPQGMQLTNLGQAFEDFADTAAVVAQMDLVISIDTSVAHLAGAMGKPLWLLLHGAADWRWLQHRSDSPWYPTARLFRQKRPGQWRPAIQDVADELMALLQSRSQTV